MSSHSAPIDVLSMLHGYFSRLDAMVESLGAYKVRSLFVCRCTFSTWPRRMLLLSIALTLSLPVARAV